MFTLCSHELLHSFLFRRTYRTFLLLKLRLLFKVNSAKSWEPLRYFLSTFWDVFDNLFDLLLFILKVLLSFLFQWFKFCFYVYFFFMLEIPKEFRFFFSFLLEGITKSPKIMLKYITFSLFYHLRRPFQFLLILLPNCNRLLNFWMKIRKYFIGLNALSISLCISNWP